MRLLFALLILFAPACPSTDQTSEALQAPIRVLILGDSISIGYTPVVTELLQGEAVVQRPRNPKGNPENCAGTTKGIEHIDRWLAADGGDWDVIHFNFGLHDLKRVDAETGRNSTDPADPHQASLDQYLAQLGTILDALQASGARLVFATTTPVPEGGVRPHRDPEDVVRYNSAARQLMATHGVAVLDLYQFALERLEDIQKPVDVHFTKEGSAALGQEVAGAIRTAAGW